MADTFQIEIVTPERLVVEDRAEEVQIPSKRGYLGILPGHAPLITELAVGEISYRPAGQNAARERLAVAWGFAEVLPDKVTVLAETAEKASEIDVERAQRACDRAEGRLAKPTEQVDIERCQTALQRAQTRLQVAGKSSPPQQ